MKCLRCGRKIAAKASFCDDCLKTVSVPLPQSPYLNTQINLNTRKAPSQAPSANVHSGAKTDKPSKSRKGLIAAVIILSVLCLALAAGCLWLGRDELSALLRS